MLTSLTVVYNKLRWTSLEQSDAVEYVSQSSFVPSRILVELAIVGTHLQVTICHGASLTLRRGHVLFQGAATAQVGNLGL